MPCYLVLVPWLFGCGGRCSGRLSVRGRFASKPRQRRLAYFVLALLLFLAIAPLVGMALFVGWAAVALRPPNPQQWQLLQLTAVVFVMCGIVSVVLRNVEVESPHAARPKGQVGSRRQISHVLLVLGIAPLIVMTLFVVAAALLEHPIVGPEPNSFFARIGLAASYALPMLVIALAILGHAIDQRSSSLALAGGLLINLCGTAAFLLGTRGAGLLDLEQWTRLAQLNASIASLYSLGWVWFVARSRFAHCGQIASGLVETQMGNGAGVCGPGDFPALALLFWQPQASLDLR